MGKHGFGLKHYYNFKKLRKDKKTMNKVCEIGNLGQDPEVKYLDNEKGTCITTFSIAVPVYSKKENKDIPNWFKCKALGKTAENIGEYFKKGHKIGIEGELRTDTWEKDGQKHSMTYILVNSFDFLTKKNNQENEGHQKFGEEELTPENIDTLIGADEIPF